MDLPELNEENCIPGAPLRPNTVVYDEAFVSNALARTGESIEDYKAGGRSLVPPMVFFSAYGRLIHETYHYETGVHVSSEMNLIKVPELGTTGRVTGEVLRLFDRNGSKYVTFKVVVNDDSSGDLLAEVEHTSIYKLAPRPAG